MITESPFFKNASTTKARCGAVQITIVTSTMTLTNLSFSPIFHAKKKIENRQIPLPHPLFLFGQTVACAPVTQQVRVRSPVGTSFLGEVFSGFFLTCKTNVRKL